MADGGRGDDTQREALAKIEALVGRLAWRIRAQRALEWATTAAVVGLLAWMVGVALYKTGWVSWGQLVRVGWASAGLVALVAVLGGLMRLDRVKLAQRIDRSHALHDRLSTALSLAEEPERAERAIREAQLEDAVRHTAQVELKRAAPWRWPQEVALVAAMLVCAVGLHLLKAPSHKRELVSPTIKVEHRRILDKATVQLERERIEQLRELVKDSKDPRMQELVEELDALLDDVEQQKISEKEFLGKLDELQKKMVDRYKEQDNQRQELRDKLKEAAEKLEKEASKELKDQQEVRALVEALKREDMKGAKEALDALAKKLEDKDLSARDLEQMAKLAEKFADKIDPDDPKLKKLFEENESKLKDLIEKLEKKGLDKLSEDEKQRLNRAKEDLDKLNKDRESSGKQDATSRQLKQLKREVDEMAKKMKQEADDKKKQTKQNDREKAREQGGKPSYRQEAAKQARQAAKQAGEQEQQKRGEQARRDAQKQLEELRESMQRQRGRGDDQGQRQQDQQIEDFMRRAQGKEQEGKEQEGKQGHKGQQGQQGQARAGQEDQGQDKQPEDGQAGDSKQGGKQGDGEEGKDKGAEGGDKPGEGEERSRSAGKGQGSRELGEETELRGRRVDSKVEGQQLRQGQSRSEIIKSASEKGFATRQYKEVYGDYSSVVEEVMEKENVPKGYRYYVKRYFQLIKPRGQE
jgi:hypothetical protein